MFRHRIAKKETEKQHFPLAFPGRREYNIWCVDSCYNYQSLGKRLPEAMRPAGAFRREGRESVLASKSSRSASRKRRRNIGVILRLIFCPPLGLYLMWTRTRWPRLVKVSASALIAFAIVLILTPMTDPPARQTGGVRVVGSGPQVELLGPEAPENRESIDIYTPRRTAIIVEATPTPEPIIVYCNIGGQYYHSKNCKWVKPTTPSVSLLQAVRAGYSQCPDCDAPSAESVT